MLGYLDGGFQVLINELAKRIRKNGGKIKTGIEVDDKILKQVQDDYDKVISTAPTKGVEYLGSVTVIFISKQNLSKYYWHNINDLNSPFLAFIQHTNLVDKAKYEDKHVYYLGTYLPHNDSMLKLDDQKISNKFFDYLEKILPDFDRKKIEKKIVFKLRNAQHVVDTEYQVPEYFEGKNLFRVNFSQIFPEDRGMNYAVKEAEKAVRLIGT